MSDVDEGEGKDPIGEVGKAVGVLQTFMSVAEKSPELKAAGTNVARAAQTVTALVDNFLLPIAVVNYAFAKGRSYFENKFQKDLEEVTASVPQDCLVEPKASIAAPILQGLTFAHEEDVLRQMFLHLLKSSMDIRSQHIAHPAFVEIIKQLSAGEAHIIRIFLRSQEPSPIAEIHHVINDEGNYFVLQSHLLRLFDIRTTQPVVVSGTSAMVDNWIRLGIVNVDYLKKLSDESSYDWVKERPEYKQFIKEKGEDKVKIQKGIVTRTALGADFWSAVN